VIRRCCAGCQCIGLGTERLERLNVLLKWLFSESSGSHSGAFFVCTGGSFGMYSNIVLSKMSFCIFYRFKEGIFRSLVWDPWKKWISA